MPIVGEQIRKLKISAPSPADVVSSKLRSSVILVAKYDFTAESSAELSVKKGDVLKLLDKLPNGWVLVKSVERMTSPGLIPCLYVDIAVNDTMHPITLQWLHESKSSASSALGNTSFYDAEVKQLLRNNSPITINNRPYPLAASITNFLMFDNRYWYRVDITYSTNERAYLCKYYQDFYSLHASLLEHVEQLQKELETDEVPEYAKPPKLPEPIPSNKRSSAELEPLLLKRSRELHDYVNSLIQNKHYQVSHMLLKWLDLESDETPGFVVPGPLNETNDAINERVLPGSVKVFAKQKVPNGTESERLHAAMERREVDDRAAKFPMTSPRLDQDQRQPVSRNIYNHYQQVKGFQGELQRAKTTRELSRAKSTRELGRSVTRKAPPHEASQGLGRSKTLMQPKRAITTPVMGGSPSFTPTAKAVNGNPFGGKPPAQDTSFSFDSERDDTETPNTSVSFDNSILSPLQKKVADKAQGAAAPAQIKVQIKTQTKDKLMVRFNASDIISLAEFKRLVYQKFAFNNLYISLGASDTYEEMDSSSPDLLQQIRESETVNVLLT